MVIEAGAVFVTDDGYRLVWDGAVWWSAGGDFVFLPGADGRPVDDQGQELFGRPVDE